MATAKRGLPDDWQDRIFAAMRKMQHERPGEAVFGLSLPASWKSELERYVRNGEVRRLFHLLAVSFSGDAITRLESPSA